jgi:hypothetical protein
MRDPNDIVRVGLRIPEYLRRKLTHAAKKSRCSLNAEMQMRLLDSFENPDIAHRELSDIVLDMEAHWRLYADRFLCLELAEKLARAVLAQAPDAAGLAKFWLERVSTYRRGEKETVS